MPFQFLLRLLAGILIVAASVVPSAAKPLPANKAFELSIDRAEDASIALRWKIVDGYYLYREQLQAIDAANGDAVALHTEAGIVEENDDNFGPSEVYYTQALARLNVDAPEQVTITWQGCQKESICYPPQTATLDTRSLALSDVVVGFGSMPTASAPMSAVGPAAETADGFQLAEDATGGGIVGSLLASGGVAWVIVSFLAFGVLLAFTPCVLPMYPILSAMLAREGETLTARRGFVLSSSYVVAMAAAFGALGIVAAWSGQNLQLVLQSPYAIGVIAALFTVLAASMFGLFELQLPAAWMDRMTTVKAGRRGSIGGAAAMGFLSALIVGPCVTAPLAAALLYIAQTGNAWLGASALFALGLGQGLPLIAFGTLGSRALPKSGAWMVQVKYLFGFVFLGAAIWMAARIVAPQPILALWSVLLLTAAVFLGVAERLPDTAQALARFRKAAALALSLAGVILAVGAASGGTDPLRPLVHFSGGAMQPVTVATFTPTKTATDLQAKLASSAGRPTLVYFTADWCVTCKAIERDVLPGAEIVAGLDRFQRLKVDLTQLDDANQTLMRDLGVVGPPTMIFFDADGAEVSGSRLVGDVTTQTLQASMARVR